MKAPSPEALSALRRIAGLQTRRRKSPLLEGLRWAPPALRDQRQCTSSSSPRRRLWTSARLLHGPGPRRGKDRGPASTEDTQTDFGNLDVLGGTPRPTTSIDACLDDGFHLDSGLKIGAGSGCLLVGGEAFSWRPWDAGAEKGEEQQRGRGTMLNGKRQWDVRDGVWGVLELVWPKPDLLILGLGAGTFPLSPETRRRINSLGIRVDVQDTRNAAAQFNLLATERGVGEVAAALIPIGWRGGR